MKKLWILALALLTGCSAYQPKAVIPNKFYLKQAKVELSGDWIATYNALPEATAVQQQFKTEERNRRLNELIILVDNSYSQFESGFYGGVAKGEIASDFLQLGLSGAGAITNGERVKTILALVATTTAGGKASIDAHWYDQQSRSAIVAKMRASRLTQLAVLEQGMLDSLGDYPLEQGLRDIQTYYSEGTVSSALQEIAVDAGQQTSVAKQTLKKLHNGR